MRTVPIPWGLLPLVVAGGAVGVAARQALLLPFAGGQGFSFGVLGATIAINAIGAGLLGFVVGRARDDDPRRRAFLGAGVLGGFTTYSGFAVLQGQLLGAGLVLPAVLAALVALLVAAAATVLGLRAGARSRRAPGDSAG
ncbi:CrcB family protein [Microbacterium album]|uniref:Fluoride-specific ion channel n=1 Tax=Microbacterium album TaxID=2053191 RepID=A0A917IFU0_9MICO|nr:CrcB family protein [Microbacterium album]GGH42081.1 hypothetical protein GCM10010921_15080 [Microbacterium album]